MINLLEFEGAFKIIKHMNFFSTGRRIVYQQYYALDEFSLFIKKFLFCNLKHFLGSCQSTLSIVIFYVLKTNIKRFRVLKKQEVQKFSVFYPDYSLL